MRDLFFPRRSTREHRAGVDLSRLEPLAEVCDSFVRDLHVVHGLALVFFVEVSALVRDVGVVEFDDFGGRPVTPRVGAGADNDLECATRL